MQSALRDFVHGRTTFRRTQSTVADTPQRQQQQHDAELEMERQQGQGQQEEEALIPKALHHSPRSAGSPANTAPARRPRTAPPNPATRAPKAEAVRDGGLQGGRVLLVIAHRIETIMDCDLLLVLHAGQLVESGSPASLVARPSGMFGRMCAAAHAAAVMGDGKAEGGGQGASKVGSCDGWWRRGWGGGGGQASYPTGLSHGRCKYVIMDGACHHGWYVYAARGDVTRLLPLRATAWLPLRATAWLPLRATAWLPLRATA